MPENEVTKVRFTLLEVLTFLVILVGVCLGYLFVAQVSAKDERTKQIAAVCERVTKLETQYDFIAKGIQELKAGQEKLTEALSNSERERTGRVKTLKGRE